MKRDALVSSIENSNLDVLALIHILCLDFLSFLRGEGDGFLVEVDCYSPRDLLSTFCLRISPVSRSERISFLRLFVVKIAACY